MSYCTNCGTQLSSVAKFCPNCGQKFISNKTTAQTKDPEQTYKPAPEKLPEAMVKPNNKKYTWLYWTAGILLVFGAIILYDYFTYPKNEVELRKLYCDKYWKASSFDIDEIYLNDTLISKPSSNIKNTIKNLVDSDSKAQLYAVFQQSLEERLKYDDFFIIHYNSSQKKYLGFNFQYDTGIAEYTYSESTQNLKKEGSRFVFEDLDGFTDEYSLTTGERVVNLDNFTLEKSMLEIRSISTEELDVKEDVTIINNDTKEKIRFICNTIYKHTKPKPKFLSKLEDFKLFWNSPEADYSGLDF